MAGLSIPSPGSSAGGRGRGRPRRKRNRSFGLQLTSMMDVLVIIVIFLLKSYGLSIMQVPQQDKLELPKSKATDVFGEGIVLQIAQNKIMIDNVDVLQFKPDTGDKKFVLPDGAMDTKNAGQGIFPIFDVLKKKKEDFDTLASRAPNPGDAAKKWTGDLLVQADKEVPYELIRNVMYTAGMAGYKQFRLTVQKQDN